ncbi:MAG: NAD(P)-dependent oxidoreductase [Pseudobdellovibrio sp.]
MKNITLEKKIKESFLFFKNKKIFVTGGTGFFGKSLLALINRYPDFNSFNMVILSRDPEKFLNDNEQFLNLKNINFHKGDITSFTFPTGTFDFVLHFATPADSTLNINHPDTMASIITAGMQRIIDFAVHSKVKKFLFASSGAVYGIQPHDLSHIPETYIGSPLTNSLDAAYGEAKRYAELVGCISARKHNFEFKIARCFAFTGSHLNQDGNYAIANFIKDALTHSTILIKGDGSPYRSYLYADDLIVWLITILEHGKNCEIYNVGSDQDITISQLANQVAKTLSSNATVHIQTPKVDEKPSSRYVPSIKKAQLELGLEVWTPLDEAIRLSSNKTS